jgi:hypothetical protein
LHFVPDDATVVVRAAKRCIPCDRDPPRGSQKLQRLTSLIDFVAEYELAQDLLTDRRRWHLTGARPRRVSRG